MPTTANVQPGTSVTLFRYLQTITETYILSAVKIDSIMTLFGIICIEPA